VTQSRTRSCPLAAHLNVSCSFLGATSRIVSLIPVRALGPDHKRAKKSDSRFVESAIWTYFCVIPSVWKCGNCVDRLPFLNDFTLRSTDLSSQYLPCMHAFTDYSPNIHAPPGESLAFSSQAFLCFSHCLPLCLDHRASFALLSGRHFYTFLFVAHFLFVLANLMECLLTEK
jgi:hypothetical protein